MNNINTAGFEIRGHTVSLLSPSIARITIKCPFGRTDWATFEERSFVMNNTQSVVNYMIKEGFFSPEGGINIMVLTSHPQSLN